MFDLGSRPEELSTFVGRKAEVGELREAMHGSRALTLCGVGGIGKSRLALRLLTAVADEYPDGACFADLSELRQPDHVVTQVAAVVGVAEEPGRPLLDTLADALRHRRAVLVLDNCEHLIGACASLCQRLLASSPGLQIIATSREPLRVAAETVWQVPPLTLPPGPSDEETASADELSGYDAVRLFTERAAAVAAGFTPSPASLATVGRICRALDGLPLAIELAAAWVRVLSVEQIAARLGRRLALLTSLDRGVPARQQTLRATLDWSYGLLTEPEQVLLRRLSVLAGWSLDMAEEVCADGVLAAADVIDLLTALADKSLVEVEAEVLGQVRYRMLETVREYAAQQLDLAGETAAMQRRMRGYTVREVERLADIGMARERAPWSARVGVFRRFDLEAANLREVLGGCLADGDAESGLRICAAARPVWIVRGTFAEGVGWLDGFLGMPAAGAVPDRVRGPALVSRAQLALAMGSDQAEQLASAGLERCQAAADPFWIATALNLLTEIAMHAGRLAAAAATADEALAVAASAGDRWNEGYALGSKAAVVGRQGRLPDAERLGTEALAAMRDIDQLWGAARTLLGLGDLALLRAQLGLARDRYLEALGILRDVSGSPEIARCLAGLGRIALEQADAPTARRHLTEGLQLSYAAGSRIGIARGLELVARLCVVEGYPQAAVQLAGAVTALRADARLPAMPAARTQRILDAAAGLGLPMVQRLWLHGQAMTPADAVRLALADPALDMARCPATPANAVRLALADPALGMARRPATPAGDVATADPLTKREHEVVALVTAGLSNRENAAQLVISHATAARHVANILAKLGFSSRSQIAAWSAAAPGQPGRESAPGGG